MAIKTVDIGNVNWTEVMPKMPVATNTRAGLLSALKNTDIQSFQNGGIHHTIHLCTVAGTYLRAPYIIFGFQATTNTLFEANIMLFLENIDKAPSVEFILINKSNTKNFNFVLLYKRNGNSIDMWLHFTGNAVSDANYIYIMPLSPVPSVRNNIYITDIEDTSGYTIINPTSI